MSSVPSNPESSSRLSTPPVAVLKARPISSLRVSGKTHSPELAPPALGPGEGGGAVVLKGTASEASRNLALGVVAALAAVPIGGVAFWWAPKESFVAMATAVVVGLSLFLAFQLRLLLQRNGIFLLLAGAFTLTLFVPIGVRLMETGSEMAQTFSEFKHQQFQQTARPSPSPIAFGAMGQQGDTESALPSDWSLSLHFHTALVRAHGPAFLPFFFSSFLIDERGSPFFDSLFLCSRSLSISYQCLLLQSGAAATWA